MKSRVMDIVIGIPAFNEEKNIGITISKLKKISERIIVCDDGSTDLTSDICKGMGVTVLKHKKNLGYGAAIKTIFLKSKEMKADVLVTFDADGQHNVDDIKKVLNPIQNDESDIVIGSRFLKELEDIPSYRRFGIKVITGLTNFSLKEKLTDSQSGFRAYSKTVLDEIVPSDTGMGVSTEILIKASSRDFRIAEVPITISYEGDTSTHNPVSHGTSVVLSTLKFISIEHPLKFYGIPAVILLLIGISFVIWSVQIYTEEGSLITNITLIGATTTILGVILSITAILLFTLVSVIRENNTR